MSIAARRSRGEPGGGAGSADETSRGALPGPAGERLGGVADALGRQRVPGPPSNRLVVAVWTAKPPGRKHLARDQGAWARGNGQQQRDMAAGLDGLSWPVRS